MLFKKNNTKLKNLQLNCEKKLKEFSVIDIKEVYERLQSAFIGLTDEVSQEKLDEFGENIIKTGKERGMLSRLFDSLVNPFNIVLLVIAVITFISDVVISNNRDYTTAIIIIVLILISSAISFFQGESSNKAAKNLYKPISNKVDVFREGKQIEISIENVVPGDVIALRAGDMLPGDVRFLTTKDTFISQAALTGESEPIEKFNYLKDDKVVFTDLSNIGFMGSNIISGSAKAIVLSTGNDTYFGTMAKSLSGDKSKNSFEQGVDSVSKLLMNFMLIMVPIIFVINGLFKGDWANSFLFALTIAVGLTPELLPMIMTTTLAKGALTMSKHNTIVKSLSAIQTFGEMDILCTDKTGTLTEDKIVLEKYMDIHGNDDTRVLRHAFLNSYFQTGLKNLIDVAIINRANENGLDEIKYNYKVIDEIPFDFVRRRMSVVLENKEGKKQLITKGAFDEIASICKYVEYNGQIMPITEQLKKETYGIYEKYNNDGLRVIAVAQKNDIANINTFGVSDENDMVLIGFVGFLDPPKESAKKAIDALNKHGIRVVVLTGDSEGVAKKVCNKVGIDTSLAVSGLEIEDMSDEQLITAIKQGNLFSKLSPVQKRRIVSLFQSLGHTVGFMGDGINDAPALSQADVGISVDSAVDIAKETSDIILLKKDLMVLEEGVVEGRKTFGNIIKYIKMAASGNFGNMISVMIASIFLPFLPLLPVHILVQNLLCDFSQMGIPFDNVDKEYLQKPRRWETKSIKHFMFLMGPLSSLFDVVCFVVLWKLFSGYGAEYVGLFQTGWFIFGTLSQILIVHMIRTIKIPFIQSRASTPLLISSLLVGILAVVIAFTKIALSLDLATLPLSFMPWLALLLIAYSVCTQIFKMIYVKKYGEWL